MTREAVAANVEVILDRAKEIASLFDRPDGTTEGTMLSISFSGNSIGVYGFNFDENNEFQTVFRGYYFRNTGKMEIE